MPPFFSYAENFDIGYALVKKLFSDGEKATIIDTDGNIILDRWYDNVGSNERTILFKSKKSCYVIFKSNFSIIKEYLDAKYDGKGDLIPVH